MNASWPSRKIPAAPGRLSGRWLRTLTTVLILSAALWLAVKAGPPSDTTGSITADPPRCAAHAPPDAVPLSLPFESNEAMEALVDQTVCLTLPLVVAEIYELRTSRPRVLAADLRPSADTDAQSYTLGTLHIRPLENTEAALLAAAGEDPLLGRAAAGTGPWRLSDGDLRNGDLLHGLYGRLQQEGGGLLLETAGLWVEQLNPRPQAPPELGEAGHLRLAAVNTFNWFVTLGERGAATAPALERQAAKLVATLLALDADVLALSEVENGEAALDDLLRRLNEAQVAQGREPDSAYKSVPIPPQGSGSDAIRVAIAYRPARLSLAHSQSDASPIHDRPPLAATFDTGGERFTVVSVHHKSKSGCPVSGDNVDQGSGCWDQRRAKQSEALIAFAEVLATQVGDADVLVMGDLNAYRREAPVLHFSEQGWRVLVDDMPPERAYSYVYFGRAGALDHGMASPSLASQVTGAAFWAVNADERPRADERLPTPFRTSDHDPLLLTLDLGR